MKIKHSSVFFSTGKEVYANCGIIGLSQQEDHEDDWQVSEGWDGGFAGYASKDLTDEERVELADYMINLWQQFKDRYGQPRNND